ncbi:MAG: O-antigen ligase family protein [Methylomonas sp.]
MQVFQPVFEKWQSAVVLSLLAFILVLPSFETPKTIFLCLFYLLSIYSIWKNRDQYRWQNDDTLLVFWMLSGFVVASFAGIHYKEWDGAISVLKLVLFLLVLKNIPFGERLGQTTAILILVSTLLATGEGLWQLFITKKNAALELSSVGHVNHSAIYLVLNFALALAITIVLRKSDRLAKKIFWVFCLLITAGCVVLSNSRASVLTTAVIALSFGLVWLKRSKWPLLVLALGILVAASGLYSTNASVVQKHVEQTAAGPYLGERQAIWNSSLLAWRHFPLFGLGLGNFSQSNLEMQKAWLAEEGKPFVEGQYLPYAHAHNLYLSTLAEQGLFGFAVTMLVLGRIGFLLYKHQPRRDDSDSYWCSWLAAFGALQVVLVNGLFNTTLHTEHGLLTLLLIGLWWSRLKLRVQR